MDLHFTCRQCGSDFDADLPELVDDPTLVCPECGQEADAVLVEDVAGAIEEVLTTASRLKKTFALQLGLDIDLDAGEISTEVEDEEDEEEDEDEDIED